MRPALALALGTSLLVASIVRADVAPPPGYDEPCTLEKVQKEGQDCKLCKTYYGNPSDHCSKEVGEGYSQSCRTNGASVWSEVWCKPAGSVSPSPSPTPSSTPAPTATPTPSSASPDASTTRPSSGGGCALASTGPVGSGSAWLYGVAFTAVFTAASRRRSRSSRA